MEMYSDPIPIPASYAPSGYAPTTVGPRPPVVVVPPTTAPATQVLAPTPPAIDERTRDQIVAEARAELLKRFGVDKDPALKEYLTLVGSLLTISTAHPNSEYEYVLLATDKPVAASVWPKTICISRGLLKQMEDESELAGVLAREISNLASARYLKAADLPTPPLSLLSPTTRPATRPAPAPTSSAQTALVHQRAGELVDLLLKADPGAEINQAADLEGARLAAAAKYAPDGYLRLLTRQTPPTSANSSAAWDRIKSLNANIEIINKAFPHAEVKLPARFESYVKPPKAETTGRH
jgi:predicted Zn-dependent protease